MNVVSSSSTLVILSRSHNLLFRVIQVFQPMGEPSSSSWNSEEDWEVVSGEAHSLVDDTTVEVDVGVKLSLDEEVITKSDSFKLNGNFNQWFTSKDVENIVSNL